MSAKRDALANIAEDVTVLSQAAVADISGTTVEILGFEEVAFVLNVGLYTDGAFTIIAEESDDDSVWTTVAAADLDGTFPTLSVSNDNQVHRVGYMGEKKFVRLGIAEPTSPNPTGVVIGCVVRKGRPHHAPV